MISPRTFLLALLVLFIAPIFSVPIHLHYDGTGSVNVYSSSSPSLKANSPLVAINARNPSPLADGGIAARSYADGDIEAISARQPAWKPRDENKKLIAKRWGFFNKIKNAVKKVGSGIAKGVSKAASGIKNGVNKVGGAVKSAAKGVATAAKKTVKFVKDNGGKIAKVYFKGVAALTKVASHAVVVIPGIGKGVGQALKRVSQVADFVSSKIPAKMSKGWEKAMNVLDRIQHPLGTGTAGKILDAVAKRDAEEEELAKRAMMEGEVLYERDIPELDARDFDGEEIEARSFDDTYELEARSFDDGFELAERSWDFEDDE